MEWLIRLSLLVFDSYHLLFANCILYNSSAMKEGTREIDKVDEQGDEGGGESNN